MDDTFRLQGKRRLLAEILKMKGIKDQRIIEAIRKIPRHFFVARGLEDKAYDDNPLPISSGQTISQPYTVAFQSELLEVETGNKVLEIGTGSGYQAAVLSELGAKVYSIERHEELYKTASALLRKMGYNINLFYGDGYKGLPTYGPFDRILVTAGATEIPDELLKQLKTGGIMVVPVGDNKVQKMTRIIKTGDNKYEITEHNNFIFVPMLKGKVSGGSDEGFKKK
ncbi:MAG: protein-L-isoaspartate(D-aspartate) O-methyltransferase [Bacteroidia bacterium]|nr:protein-L-isoaspartate(D-aspartate) O-methyltransferase [Bacteroidia bacterium]